MKLENLVLSFSSAIGKWQVSIVLKNRKSSPLKGVGFSDSKNEAIWLALKDALKIIGKDIGDYKGIREVCVVDSVRQILFELASLNPR